MKTHLDKKIEPQFMQAEYPNTMKRTDLLGWKKYWEDRGFVTEMVERGMIRREPPEALNRVFHIGPYFAFVVDYRDLTFQYIKGVENVLGYAASDLYKRKMEHLVELVHPDDIQKVLGLSIHFFSFLEQQPPEKRLDFWPSINFRMRKANGQYIRVLEQVICLKTDDAGRITHALKYFTDISHLNYSNEVVLAFFNAKANDGRQFYTFNLEEKETTAENGVTNDSFSTREKEILSMIAEGKTSKEIASTLSLSRHTINKHRENMMRKTGCKNMNEVISFAYCSEYL